jgi:hypothetical protein
MVSVPAGEGGVEMRDSSYYTSLDYSIIPEKVNSPPKKKISIFTPGAIKGWLR